MSVDCSFLTNFRAKEGIRKLCARKDSLESWMSHNLGQNYKVLWNKKKNDASLEVAFSSR